MSSFHYVDDVPLVGIMDWIVSPPNPYIEVLFPNVIVFGARAFNGIITVKWGVRVGP